MSEGVQQPWTDAERVASWHRWNPQFAVQTRAATEAILQAAQIRPGMRVLDLASGTGEPALSIAAAVGPDGHVTATDLVPGMLAVAEENARQSGLTNITFRQSDAHALPFSEATFDAVTCRFGVMFFADVGKALRETLRVLKPNGRAVFTAWGPPEENPMFTTTTAILMKYVEGSPPVPEAEAYRFARAGLLSSELKEAGFEQGWEEFLNVPWPWPGSVEQAWESTRDRRGKPFRELLDRVPPDQLPKAMDEILAAIRRYDDGEQVNFRALIVLATGVRPAAHG